MSEGTRNSPIETRSGHRAVFSEGYSVIKCAQCGRCAWSSMATRSEQLDWLDLVPCRKEEPDLCGVSGFSGTCGLSKGHSGPHK